MRFARGRSPWRCSSRNSSAHPRAFKRSSATSRKSGLSNERRLAYAGRHCLLGTPRSSAIHTGRFLPAVQGIAALVSAEKRVVTDFERGCSARPVRRVKEGAVEKAFGIDIPRTLEDVCDPRRLALLV